MTVGFNYLGRLGQLGNQMFQYAATLGSARHRGDTFAIPKHNEVYDNGSKRLKIELFDCFDIKPDKIGYLKTDYVLAEKGFEYDESILNAKQESDFTLYGFFQTGKYFKHCEDEVREQFTFKQEIIDECKQIVEDYFDNPIALHIRRGDYLTNPNHCPQSNDYYEEALSKFESDRQVVIFSDDPDWCMKQELFSDDRFIVSESAGPYHDLYMMTQCSDFIIANSSFSWWGAWLANVGKVIAPKKWFGEGNKHLNTKDVYCENWEVL